MLEDIGSEQKDQLWRFLRAADAIEREVGLPMSLTLLRMMSVLMNARQQNRSISLKSFYLQIPQSEANLRRMCRLLERKGLVRMEQSQFDGRSRVPVATPLLEKIYADLEAAMLNAD